MHGCSAVRYSSLLTENQMNKTRHILTSLLAALSLSACAGDVLPATDETLKAELEIITPVVGYGGNFEALLMCSSESIVFTEVDCRYPILVNGSELNRYETYNMSGSGLRLTTAALRAEADTEVTLHLTLKDPDSGQMIMVSGSFTATCEQISIPKSIKASVTEVMLSPGDEYSTTSSATISLSFNPEDCVKDYILSYSREDWKEMIEVTQEEGSFTLHAPVGAKGGNMNITITSKYNSFVNTQITVKIRKDVALVITGTTCGDKARVTWNQYESYLFTSLYCYIAEWEGDLESVMRSNSKDASGLTFKISQSSFNYDIEYVVERLKGSELKRVYFPYRCLSNAHMSLSVISGHINAETDRRTRDDTTGYQYYTLKVSRMSYNSELYNIRYIVHLYKAKKDGHWIACNDFSSGYNLERNKYWYAAADTDEWIIKRN